MSAGNSLAVVSAAHWRTPSGWGFEAVAPSRRKVLELARRVAPCDSPVLILGPTGVGKEVLAHDLHRNSARAKGPLISVNCAAIAPSLLESELFGHVKGSFTGAAADRVGLVELAHGGTLFLDEIGELSEDGQAKLLRFLAQGTYWPVGSSVERRANVRILAATHRDLESMKGSSFREDLFYRLSVFILRIPALEPVDVCAIARVIALSASERNAMVVSEAEIDTLSRLCAARPWQGGARELKNMIERLLVLRDPQVSMEEHCNEILALTSAPIAAEAEGEAEAPSGIRPRNPNVSVAKDLDNLMFLGIAEGCKDVRELALRTDRTVQAVYARLKKLDLEPNQIGRTPALLAVAERLKERLAPDVPWIQALLSR